MPLHAWSDHVVHIELLSSDGEIATTTGLFLERRFAAEQVEVASSPGRLEVRSDVDAQVSAAEVAHALLGAGVRAHTVQERQEWSVAEVSAP